MTISQYVSEHWQTAAHWFGIVGTAAATLAGWLPPIAALVSIIWGCLQIYSWFEKRGRR